MTEKWKPVVGYEEFYEVSNKGQVRSLDRLQRSGNGIRLRKGRILKPGPTGIGGKHLSVVLCRPATKNKTFHVHRLVAEAWIKNPENLPCVLHWDDNGHNNRKSNLRWGTYSDNTEDSKRNGHHVVGERNNLSRLTEKQVLKIRSLHDKGWSNVDLAERYGVSRVNIHCIVKRKSWAHL